MNIKIVSISIIQGFGPDFIHLSTELPNGCWPFKGEASLKMEVACGDAERYCAEHFPAVPVTHNVRTSGVL